MELFELAERVLHADTLDEKLLWPAEGLAALTDTTRGPARAWSQPGRPPELVVAPRDVRLRFPSARGLHDKNMRVRWLHTFANHELMALELMAWALLAYPDAPPRFRMGLAWLIEEEQRHLRLYMDRIAALGATFGDLPVNDHFWRCAPSLRTPVQWVCAVNLTFEQANLDHAPEYAACMRAVEDVESAALLDQIERDEIKHVGFGARWLRQLQHPDSTRDSFDLFLENLTDQNTPSRARGKRFNRTAREAAGLEATFIDAMSRA